MKWIERALLTVLVLLLIGFFLLPRATAQPCAAGARVTTPTIGYGHVVQAPIVQHAPVYAGSHHLQPSLGFFREVYYIPTAVPAPVGLDYQFSVRDSGYDQNTEDRIVERVLSRVLGRVAQAQPQAPVVTAPPAVIPNNLAITSASPPGGGVSRKGIPVNHVAGDRVKTLFAARCTRCHGDAGVIKGSLDLSDTAKLTIEDWAAIAAQTQAKDMPVDDKPLLPDEVALLYDEYKAALKKRSK